VPAPAGEAAAQPASPAEAPKPEHVLSIDDRAKISRMQGDLRWLVTEGYVTEFIDGRLFAPPPMVEARKKEVEAEEHDPENFPEAPASETAPATPSTPQPEPTVPAPGEPEVSAPVAVVTAAEPVAPAAPEEPKTESAPSTPAAS
jgi:hypothetical protein